MAASGRRAAPSLALSLPAARLLPLRLPRTLLHGTQAHRPAHRDICRQQLGCARGASYAYLDEVIARFEAEHPGVKVTYQSGIRKTDYPEWLAGRALAGEMPDVILIPQDDFNLYAGLGALLPLDDLAKRMLPSRSTTSPPRRWPPPAAPTAAVSTRYGRMHAAPDVRQPHAARARGHPVPQDDWTWDDFLAICRKVTRDTDGDGRLDQFGVYGYTWQDAVITSGASLFRPDGRASLHGRAHRAQYALPMRFTSPSRARS